MLVGLDTYRGRQAGDRCFCHSYAGTKDSPSSLPTSWAWLQAALPFATDSMHDTELTTWHLNTCLRRPKHQSGANLVCLATKKLRVMDLWSPVAALHAQYHWTKLFLFWPVQLWQWRWTLPPPPSPKFSKKRCRNETTAFDPLLMRWASSIRKFTCRGRLSQQTPNIPSFQGTRKYMGPGHGHNVLTAALECQEREVHA